MVTHLRSASRQNGSLLFLPHVTALTLCRFVIHHPHRRRKHTSLPTSPHAYKEAVHTANNCVFPGKSAHILIKGDTRYTPNTRLISMARHNCANKLSSREVRNELSLGWPKPQGTMIPHLIANFSIYFSSWPISIHFHPKSR